MGYKIFNISEIDSLDWTTIKGKKETVRKSLDGSKFIVKSDLFNDLTQEQALIIMNTEDWNINK